MAVHYDYKKFQEEHMGHFDNKLPPDQWHKRPTTVIIDDIFSDKPYTQKGTSMSIFKFTTTKPSSLKIWTTLMETTIAPREGYSVEQIKYRMFIYLQLDSDFRLAVSHCNICIDSDKASLIGILEYSRTLASCTESDFSDLSVSSEAFPHWVSSELYTPYYLTKQLCHKLNNFTLLLSLFDRIGLLANETQHWNIDQMSIDYPGLTAYKLENISYNETLNWINISYNQNPLQISSRDELKMHIRDELLDALESADNFIIPDGSKITIPYFVLKTDNMVPETRSSSTTRPFVVGDRVRLRSDLVDKEGYGDMTFFEQMRFDDVTTISEASSSGNFQLGGFSNYYSAEMLEHAEGGTDAS